MANFVSSITLQFRDLFSPGMAQAHSSVSELQNSLSGMNAAGLENVSSGMKQAQSNAAGLQESISAVNEEVSSINKEVPSPNLSRFTQGLNEIQAGLDQIAENNALNTLATQLSVMSMAVAPIQQSLNSALDKPSQLSAAFESSMTNIQAITGNSTEEMAALNRQLLEIGKNAAAGPQGAANAMNDIAGGVDNAASHLGILQGAVLLAEAGQADLGVSANGLVSIMNAYGLASGDAASAMTNAVNVSDVLTQTVGQGVGSMEQFIAAFSQVSGVSASVGVGFDEVGAALAFITTQGPTASESATQVKAALIALLNPNETLAKALQSVGIESGSAMLAEYGLVESLNIVKQSVGGSQDAMAKALGSTMALQGATALLGDGYTDFSAKFGAAIQNSVTAEAAAIQNQSYEMKMAKMTAATQALQLQVGDNINNIKGFFAEMGAGFLTNVVSPIMSSPVGGVLQQIAAVAGVTGQNLLSMGGSALQAAVHFSTLAANIKNAGGYAKIFHGTGTIISGSFKGAGTAISGTVKNIGGAFAALVPVIAAFGAKVAAIIVPVLPVVAAVAAVIAVLAVGGYFLVKHWNTVSAFFVNLWNKVVGAFSAAFNWIKEKLAGVSDWVLVAVAVFMPFIGIPALIIKHWEAIKNFFINLWNNITGAFAAAWDSIRNLFNTMPTWIGAFLQSLLASITEAFSPITAWFGSVWNTVTEAFSAAWNNAASFFISVWGNITVFFSNIWNGIMHIIAGVAAWFSNTWDTVVTGFINLWNSIILFFSNLWNGITQIVAVVANWFSGIWGTVTAPFAAAFTWIGNLFTSIWDGMKGTVMQFVDWISPVTDALLAPFRAVGNAIGGIIDTVGGWFGKGVEAGKEAVARRTELQSTVVPENPAPIPTVPVISETVPVTPPATNTPVITAPDLAVPENTIPVPQLPAAVTTPIVSTADLNTVVPATAPAPVPEIQSTAKPAGNVLAQAALAAEHFEAAQRKGIASQDISFAASSAFDNAGGIVPVVPSFSVPDIEEEAQVTFAAAMPRRESAEPRQAQTEARNETPRQNIFHIANMNFNADEMRTIFDFVHQLELLTTEATA